MILLSNNPETASPIEHHVSLLDNQNGYFDQSNQEYAWNQANVEQQTLHHSNQNSVSDHQTYFDLTPSESTGSQLIMSPPLTPQVTQETFTQDSIVAPTFHNYLRAFHEFHPESTVTSSNNESSITVPIDQGDVILVHSIHPNGWADGTLLRSGARGWLPTNYCEPFDPPELRNLLNSLTNLWDLVRSSEHESLLAFSRQDYVRGMIAGVRLFLEQTSCLSRDSTLIVNNVGLRRLRKGLLSDLSMLVKIAKQLQDYVQYKESETVVFELLNELILKGLKVVERAVRFHDIWIESGNNVGIGASKIRPLTPPGDDSQSTTGADRLESDTNSEIAHPQQRPVSQQINQEYSIEVNPSRLSTATLPQSGAALPDSVQPSQVVSQTNMAKRASVSHRLSYLGKGHGGQKQNLASERLAAAHDSFLGLLGTFIGLHINSRSSQELAVTTHQAVQACRLLIAVVEEIWARDGRRPDSLQAARDVMYQKLADLVQTAKDMLSSAQNGDDVLNPDQGRQLVMTTTNCLLAAGDCVTKARQTIERIGDFEFEANTIGLADQIFEALNRTKTSPVPNESHHERSASSIDKPLPVPPEPTTPPPPPPTLTLNTDAKPLPEPPQLSPLFSPDSEGPREAFPDSPEDSSRRSSNSSNTPQASAPPTIHHDTVNISPPTAQLEFNRMPRTDSVNTSATSATDTIGSWRNSNTYGASTVSVASTRATTPDRSPVHHHNDSLMMNSVGSVSELQSVASEDLTVGEQVLETTNFAHELIPSKDGQVLGGSMPALIERLTTHDSTPDATFVTTFFLTFRLFTTPVEFAQGLIQRFDYIGNSPSVGVPVRLRVYNVFKGWLETHWQPETDSEVLPVITEFASMKLAVVLPTAATRIHDLISKVSERGDRPLIPRLVSSLGRNSTSVTSFTSMDAQIPTPIVTKSQLNVLRQARVGGQQCSILDFDPLELARQFTIIESRIFCSIQPEELLALEWTKKTDSRAVNVRAMSTLSTDLANLVADTILQFEEPKKRAIIIKQWVKIAMKCLELNNYDSLMAIVCSLNSSMVLRLKKTWELVSQKTKTRWDELCAIVHVGKNHQALRERLKNIVAPCIPFVGLYLTDLTFVHAGNPATRELPSSEPKKYVINFDRYVKTARTIGQLQRFQVPYKLAAVPELQDWIESQIQRINESETANVQSYYRRSLLLEPREAKAPVKTHWYSTNTQKDVQKELQTPPIPQQTVSAPPQESSESVTPGGHSPKESVASSSYKDKFDLLQALNLTKSSEPKMATS